MGINVTRSSMPSFEEYVEEIKGIWENRWLTNRGPKALEFEEMLKNYLGVPEIWLFVNGHLALESVLQTLDLKGEVITTPYSFCSTTHAIVRSGLTPVFCDVKEDNYTINPELIESLITEKTSAIVATHVYGFMCDVEKIEKIAKKHNLKVIYDGAHAFGIKLNGIGSGNFGDATMFSTHATKVFHTIEGGFVTYHDTELFKNIKYIGNFGLTNHEDIDLVGTNAKMNEFAASMGICNLRHINEEIAKRKAAGERYYERLSGVKGLKLIEIPDNLQWNYAYLPVVFDGYKENRNEIQEKLAKEDIFARKYFYPVLNEAGCYIEKYGDSHVPVAKNASEKVLTLPMYADLTTDDVDRICDIILK